MGCFSGSEQSVLETDEVTQIIAQKGLHSFLSAVETDLFPVHTKSTVREMDVLM